MGDFFPLASSSREKSVEENPQCLAILEICAKGIYVDNRDFILYFLGFALFFDRGLGGRKVRPIWDVRRRSVRWAHVCPPPAVRPGLTTALHPTTPFPPVLSRRTFEVSYLGTKHADPAFDPFVRGLCGVGLVANRCPGRIGDFLRRFQFQSPPGL